MQQQLTFYYEMKLHVESVLELTWNDEEDAFCSSYEEKRDTNGR